MLVLINNVQCGFANANTQKFELGFKRGSMKTLPNYGQQSFGTSHMHGRLEEAGDNIGSQ